VPGRYFGVVTSRVVSLTICTDAASAIPKNTFGKPQSG
jgi:hypothetical protein